MKAWALAHGRRYVIPDDVRTLAHPVLAHRLILDPEAEFSGTTPIRSSTAASSRCSLLSTGLSSER